MSGRPDVPAVVAAIKGGAVDFLSKPIEPRELRAAVTVQAQRARALNKLKVSSVPEVARLLAHAGDEG